MMAGMSPAKRERSGVAMRTKRSASRLKLLGKFWPKNAGLKAIRP